MRDLVAWQEVGEGVFLRRYRSLNLNVGVVLGADGVLVVDTRASHREAKELRDHLGAVTDLPVQWVVNTHWHWDHTFGNAVFPVEIWGHTRCRARLMSEGEAARVEARSWMPPDRRDELDEVVITPPTNTFSKAKSLDLGGSGSPSWVSDTPTTTSWWQYRTQALCSLVIWSRKEARPISETPTR